MSNTSNDLDLCRSLLSIIDEMYEADGITPIKPTTEAPVKEVEEGKLPAGLQAYQDKKNGKKDADADADEDKEVDEDKDEETVEEAVEELQKIMQLAGLESIDEAMSDAYGIVPADQEADSTDGSVEFKQHKSTDKGSISVEASADNMEELQKIMQLAGLSLPNLNAPADDEPEQEELLVSPDDEQPADGEDGEEVVISPDNDASPCGEPAPDSDAKQTLVSIIKDKLQQRLK